MALPTHIQVKGGNEMPENNNRDVQDFSKYDAMTSEELAQILRLDSEAPEGNGLDIDTLLYITGVLAEHNDNTGKTAQEAWISFQQNYLNSEDEPLASIEEIKTKKARNPWVRRSIAAAAAVVLIVGIPVTAKAFNWDKIWTAMATWAKETFSFVREDQPEVDNPDTKDSRQFDSLHQTMEQTGENPNILPTWMPNGYKLVRIDVDETPMQRNYVAIYSSGDKHLTISIRSYGETDPERIEINEDLVEIYNASDVEYYIFSNYDRIRAVWIQDSYECSISGEITIEEIKMMIDSIPKG